MTIAFLYYVFVTQFSVPKNSRAHEEHVIYLRAGGSEILKCLISRILCSVETGFKNVFEKKREHW
jgi:hypothetical protein